MRRRGRPVRDHLSRLIRSDFRSPGPRPVRSACCRPVRLVMIRSAPAIGGGARGQWAMREERAVSGGVAMGLSRTGVRPRDRAVLPVVRSDRRGALPRKAERRSRPKPRETFRDAGRDQEQRKQEERDQQRAGALGCQSDGRGEDVAWAGARSGAPLLCIQSEVLRGHLLNPSVRSGAPCSAGRRERSFRPSRQQRGLQTLRRLLRSALDIATHESNDPVAPRLLEYPAFVGRIRHRALEGFELTTIHYR